MVERAEDDRPRAARSRRAAACVRSLRSDRPTRYIRGSGRRRLPRRLDRPALPQRCAFGREALRASRPRPPRIPCPSPAPPIGRGEPPRPWAIPRAAKGFYARAASVPIAYYGQLAAQRLGETRLALRAPAVAAEGDRRDEAVRAVEALYADGLDDLAAGARLRRRAAMARRVAARRHGRGGEATGRYRDAGSVRQDRRDARPSARRDGVSGRRACRPSFRCPGSADLPTVYAVARQESEFIWHANSGAGAKGLMQMLPSTAAVTARRAGVDFDYGPPHRRPRFQHPARRGAARSIDRGPSAGRANSRSPPTTPVPAGSRNGSPRMAIRATERSISSTGSSAFRSTRRATMSRG